MSMYAAEARNQQMTDTIAWWAKAFHPGKDIEEDSSVGMISAKEMQETLTWWGNGHPGGPAPDEKKAMQVRSVLDQWGDASISDKDKAKALEEAMHWCCDHYDEHKKHVFAIEEKKDTQLKMGELFDMLSESKVEKHLKWWGKNITKKVSSKGLEGDDLKKFKKTEKVMLAWRDRDLAKPTKNTGRDLEDTLKWWSHNRKKPVEKMNKEDRLMFDKLAQGVSGRKMPEYGSKEPVPSDVVEFMRNRNNIRILEDTLALWHKHDEPVDTFGHIKNEEERMKLTKLRDAFVQWQKMKLEDPLTFRDSEKIAKEIKKGIKWWNDDGGKDYDADAALDEIKSDMWKAMSCEQAVSLWQIATMRAGKVPPLSEQSQKDAIKECLDVAEAMHFFKSTGQFMDLEEATKSQKEYDLKYEKARRLGMFWGRYTAPITEDRANVAAEVLHDIFDWNLNTKKKKKPDEPEMLDKVTKLLGIWSPIVAADPNDKDTTKEILAALDWWGDEAFECEIDKIPMEMRKNLKKLKDMVQHCEKNDPYAFAATEDESLAWKRDPEAAKELTAEIEYNISDILDWFKGGRLSDEKKKRIKKLEKYMETWWDNLSEEDKKKPVDPTGQDLDAYSQPEIEQLVDIYNELNPLQKHWNEKGKDYAFRSGYKTPVETEELDLKVYKSWKWLNKKLAPVITMQKKGGDDEEEAAPKAKQKKEEKPDDDEDEDDEEEDSDEEKDSDDEEDSDEDSD